jgi:hypothetical protein
VKDHLRPYVDSIFSLVEDYWNSRHLPTILQLVEQMSEAVPDYFTNYVPRLISLLLTSLDAPRISEWTLVTGQSINTNVSSVSDARRLELVLHSIRSLRRILSEYLHLLIPSLVKLVETISSTDSALVEKDVNYSDEGDVLRTKIVVLALETLAAVIAGGDNSSSVKALFLANASTSLYQTDVSQQITARAAQPLIRMLGREPHPNRVVGIAIVETLCVCAVRLGREKWRLFYHTSARAAIHSWQTWVNYNFQDTPPSKDLEDRLPWTGGLSTYDKLIHDIIDKDDCAGSKELININEIDQQLDRLTHLGDMYDDEGRSLETATTVFGNVHGSFPQIQTVNQASAFRVNQAHLQRAWDVSQRTTREDWDEWMRRFSVQLLREAPNAALRAAAGLAHAFPSLGTELFCAAFLCCWSNLSDEYQKNLIRSLEVAFVSSDVSPEILQSLLNLCEVSFLALSHYSLEQLCNCISFLCFPPFRHLSSWEGTLQMRADCRLISLYLPSLR